MGWFGKSKDDLKDDIEALSSEEGMVRGIFKALKKRKEREEEEKRRHQEETEEALRKSLNEDKSA